MTTLEPTTTESIKAAVAPTILMLLQAVAGPGIQAGQPEAEAAADALAILREILDTIEAEFIDTEPDDDDPVTFPGGYGCDRCVSPKGCAHCRPWEGSYGPPAPIDPDEPPF